LALARSVRTVVAARGTKVMTFDMSAAPPGDDTLAFYLLGHTGHLKAPTVRVGDTLLVGCIEEAYRRLLGDG
jgi:hypothetical protein